eukprot:scaffold129933_cov48-Phaeocystis_antarctica.AAC.2
MQSARARDRRHHRAAPGERRTPQSAVPGPRSAEGSGERGRGATAAGVWRHRATAHRISGENEPPV